MKALKCIFCGKLTSIHNINVQKKINDKVVTISNAPVYYCAECNETFLSKEAQDIFSYIRDRGLENKNILYSFEDMLKKIY